MEKSVPCVKVVETNGDNNGPYILFSFVVAILTLFTMLCVLIIWTVKRWTRLRRAYTFVNAPMDLPIASAGNNSGSSVTLMERNSIGNTNTGISEAGKPVTK